MRSRSAIRAQMRIEAAQKARAARTRARFIRPRQIGGDAPKKGLTLVKLLTATYKSEFRTRYDNAVRDHVAVRAMGRTKADTFKAITTETRFPTESFTHHQMVLKLEPEKPFSRSRVAVRCDCSDYLYRAEYALSRKGAALEPNASSLEPSQITNPGNVTFLCKHLLVIAQRMLARNL